MTVTIAPLQQGDVPAADEIFRAAFAQFLSIPDPSAFTGDAAIVATRWHAHPELALGAYRDGSLVGSSFVTCWGSFGFVGPVTVRPDLWGQRVAQQLMAQSLALLEQRAVRQAALFTFPQSPKHIALYQKFGFWPQYLTAVMSKPVSPTGKHEALSRYSALPPDEQTACLAQCADLTGRIFSGLDVRPEIRTIAGQRVGETILIRDAAGLAGFACCHVGAGSEAGSGIAFVKFGAVRPGPDAPGLFARLLDCCEALAADAAARSSPASIRRATKPTAR